MSTLDTANEPELGQLSCPSTIDEPDFVQQLAELMVTTSEASYHWILLADGEQIDVLSDDDEDLTEYETIATRHEQLSAVRQQALDENRVTSLWLEPVEQIAPADWTPHGTSRGTSHGDNDCDPLLDTAGHLIFVPIRCETAAGVVVCLYCEAHPQMDLPVLLRQLTMLSLLGDMRSVVACNQAMQFAQAEQEQKYQQANAQLKHALKLGEAISQPLEKEQAAFVTANQLQNFLDVDRVTILEQVGKQSKLLAVSGQATWNKRANIVRRTEQLAKVVLKSGEPLWFDGDQDDLAPPVQQVVSRYLDESLVQSFALIPLIVGQPPTYPSEEQSLIELVNPGQTEQKKIGGAILLESINRPLVRTTVEPRWEQVAPQVSSHFNNSRRYSNLFLLPVMLMLTRFAAFYRGHTARLAWGLTLGASALLAAGLLIPTDFRVRCEGYLQPEKMHQVFVRKDGIVKDVLVKEGQAVQQGDPLVLLQNQELEFELASLTGELAEKKQARQNLIYKRLDYLSQSAAEQASAEYHELAEETSMLANQIESLEKSLVIKQKQQSELIVRAPFAGQVMGWNVDRRYLNRPLDEGTRLFTLAKATDRRLLELKVPDQRSGYVATAWQKNQAAEQSLPVEFSIASLPNQHFYAVVTHINPGLEQDSDLGYVLPMEALPQGTLPEGLRAGTPVVAKVNCGQRSFLYCKTYEFLDWMNRKSFEYLY